MRKSYGRISDLEELVREHAFEGFEVAAEFGDFACDAPFIGIEECAEAGCDFELLEDG